MLDGYFNLVHSKHVQVCALHVFESVDAAVQQSFLITAVTLLLALRSAYACVMTAWWLLTSQPQGLPYVLFSCCAEVNGWSHLLSNCGAHTVLPGNMDSISD